MEKRKFLRLRLKIRLSCSDLHYIFHILNSIGGPLGPMVQTSPSAQSDRSRTIKKIIKPVWTSSPEFGGGPSGALALQVFTFSGLTNFNKGDGAKQNLLVSIWSYT